MKRMVKQTAVAALAGVMAAGLLSGCGEKALDGTKTVATVNGAEIPMGILSLYTRQQQAQVEAMYLSFLGEGAAIWDQAASDDSDKTYGQEFAEGSLEQIEIMYLAKEKAGDYGVEVTEEDETAIAEAAAAFMENNSEETIAELAVSEDQVKEYLELQTYLEGVHSAVLEEADIQVTDEEAQQAKFTYVLVSTSDESLTEDDIAEKKEQAQEILDKMAEDPDGDVDEMVDAVDESYSALSGYYSANETEADDVASTTYPEEVLEVLRGLDEGEVAPEVVETENGYYALRLDSKNDEEATESRKESLKSTRETEVYTETTTQWLEEADIQVDEEVLNTLEITDSHSFTYDTSSVAEADEEMEDAEVIADEDFDEIELDDEIEVIDDMDESNVTVAEDDMDEIEDTEDNDQEVIEEELPEEADATVVDDMDETADAEDASTAEE